MHLRGLQHTDASNWVQVAYMSSKNLDIEVDAESDNDDYDDYYSHVDCEEPTEPKKTDPEHFEFKCFTKEEVEKFLNENVEILCASLHIKPSIAKLLLHLHGWSISEIIARNRLEASELLIDSRIKPSTAPEIESQVIRNSKSLSCPVCVSSFPGEYFHALDCGHYFCKDCWFTHFEMQIFQGITITMKCMSCSLLVPEDFVCSILNKSSIREKYQVYLLSEFVKSHPLLRFCPGPNCEMIIFAKECQNKHVICEECKISFCFKCGADYHAPTDCDTIKKWLTKCLDDSETANYITAHTKDCPNCNICIEKNGGCNHIRCSRCEHDFCWMCLGDWILHCGNYYECSKYKENPNIANESAATQAREALKKYVFCFERWENHARSLRLEKDTLQNLINRINRKVMANEGTWIDWQYLENAAALLEKCRYTLQYTYPYAYYMESGPRKELFEHQQARLEAEIENLSWKIERADSGSRGDLENQMYVAEETRATLLKDFIAV